MGEKLNEELEECDAKHICIYDMLKLIGLEQQEEIDKFLDECIKNDKVNFPDGVTDYVTTKGSDTTEA